MIKKLWKDNIITEGTFPQLYSSAHLPCNNSLGKSSISLLIFGIDFTGFSNCIVDIQVYSTHTDSLYCHAEMNSLDRHVSKFA